MPIHDWTRVEAGIFHHFHVYWLAELAKALNKGILPGTFYALAEQIAGGLGPDVLTLESPSPSPDANRNGHFDTGSDVGGGVGLLTAPPQTRFTLQKDWVAPPQRAITIRHVSDDTVVAVIEIVSPGNKNARAAYRSFVNKAREFLESRIHLLIVDLFPTPPQEPEGLANAIWGELGGTESVPPSEKPLALIAYHASHSLWVYVEPIAVGDSLPEMPLFLTMEAHVKVPLESTYQLAWEAVPKRWRDVLA